MLSQRMFLPWNVYHAVNFRGGYLLYFICLGLGFMLVELPLIQKFILFLGQPLYAIAVILSSLLIFSGIGSLLSGRFSQHETQNSLCTVIFALCVILTIYVYGLLRRIITPQVNALSAVWVFIVFMVMMLMQRFQNKSN